MEQLLNFNPQNQFQNLFSLYSGLRDESKKNVDFTEADEAEWLEYINEKLDSGIEPIGYDALFYRDSRQPYKWMQEGNSVRIEYKHPLEGIIVTNEKIESSDLNGLWWGKVEEVKTSQNGENTLIELTVTYRWPILIKGGNPDALSAFFIGLVAYRLQITKFCEMWLKKAAIMEQKSAIHTYALMLIDQKKYQEASYWVIHSILTNSDDECGYEFANMLMNGLGIEKNARLAEYILCRLCSEHFPPALTLLGQLYLSGAEGVEPMTEKAKVLLTIAAFQNDDPMAAQLLNEANLLAQESSAPLPVEDELGTIPEQNIDQKIELSTTDYLIAGAVIAGTALGALFLLGRFRKGH